MALQYPRDLVGSLMNLKNSKIFESFFWRHFSLFQFPEKLFDSGKNVNKVKKHCVSKLGEFGEMSYEILMLGELGERSLGIFNLGELG